MSGETVAICCDVKWLVSFKWDWQSDGWKRPRTKGGPTLACEVVAAALFIGDQELNLIYASASNLHHKNNAGLGRREAGVGVTLLQDMQLAKSSNLLSNIWKICGKNMHENQATKQWEWSKTMFSFRRIRAEPEGHSWVKVGYYNDYCESIKGLRLGSEHNRSCPSNQSASFSGHLESIHFLLNFMVKWKP